MDSLKNYIIKTANANKTSKVFIYPNIPQKKLDNIFKIYQKIGLYIYPNDVLVIFDDTIWGGARESIIITEKFICYKESFPPTPKYIPFSDINDLTLYKDKLFINNEKLKMIVLKHSDLLFFQQLDIDLLKGNNTPENNISVNAFSVEEDSNPTENNEELKTIKDYHIQTFIYDEILQDMQNPNSDVFYKNDPLLLLTFNLILTTKDFLEKINTFLIDISGIKNAKLKNLLSHDAVFLHILHGYLTIYISYTLEKEAGYDFNEVLSEISSPMSSIFTAQFIQKYIKAKTNNTQTKFSSIKSEKLIINEFQESKFGSYLLNKSIFSPFKGYKKDIEDDYRSLKFLIRVYKEASFVYNQFFANPDDIETNGFIALDKQYLIYQSIYQGLNKEDEELGLKVLSIVNDFHENVDDILIKYIKEYYQ